LAVWHLRLLSAAIDRSLGWAAASAALLRSGMRISTSRAVPKFCTCTSLNAQRPRDAAHARSTSAACV
jgi:hypothetical protein